MKSKIVRFLAVVLLLPVSLIFFNCSRSGANNKLLKQLSDEAQIKEPSVVMVTEISIPDSLRPAMADWIKETVRAASFHMTGGDYEDPEDVIEEAEEVAERLFARSFTSEGLRFIRYDASFTEDVPYEKLTNYEKKVFEELKKQP